MTEEDKADPRPERPDEERRSGLDGTSPARRVHLWERRREKIREEIARNRRGEYTVPTWVLVIALIVVLAGWAAIIVFA